MYQSNKVDDSIPLKPSMKDHFKQASRDPLVLILSNTQNFKEMARLFFYYTWITPTYIDMPSATVETISHKSKYEKCYLVALAFFRR